MTTLDVLFWLCAGVVAYTYAGYPLLAAALAWRRPPPVSLGGGPPPSVSIVLAVHNEAGSIHRRIEELKGLLASTGTPGELIVVVDGATDGTSGLARALADDVARVVELEENQGKAAALNAGCAASGREVVVFADARQTWRGDALERLLENFNDPEVGAVSGELVLEDSQGALAGVGLYWRFEKWLRRQESRRHSTVGVTGAVSAVRRDLFRPIPPGTILDDVYWPLQVVLQGFRVVFDGRAVAYDRLPDRVHDEFRRKVRTLGGNFQLLTRLPKALSPVRNPVWLAFLSHKLARLVVPWALLGLLVLGAVLPGPIYRSALVVQGVCYALALAGLRPGIGSRNRFASALASFLVLNAAAWLAFWVWISGRLGRSWRKVSYQRGTLDNRDPSEMIWKQKLAVWRFRHGR